MSPHPNISAKRAICRRACSSPRLSYRRHMTYTNRTPSFTWPAGPVGAKILVELYEGGVRRQDEETLVPYYTAPGRHRRRRLHLEGCGQRPTGTSHCRGCPGRVPQGIGCGAGHDARICERTLVLRWQPVDFAARYRSRSPTTPSSHGISRATPPTIPSLHPGKFGRGGGWRLLLACLHAGQHGTIPVDNRSCATTSFPEKVYLPLVIR